MVAVKYWTTMLRENNRNSKICVRRKRHMDMAWHQQLLLDSLLGKRAQTRTVFLKKSLNFHNNSLFSVTSPRYCLLFNVNSLFAGAGTHLFISTAKQNSTLDTLHKYASFQLSLSSQLQKIYSF